jgi:hypothetical protein
VSHDTPFTCGIHRAFAVELGGENIVADLTPLSSVRWQRIRDDISTATVIAPTSGCCDVLADLRTIKHELHIVRNDESVWQGPITRIEHGHESVEIHAEDMLWVPKRRVLEVGYDQAYPNVGEAIDRVRWLLEDQCFAKYGDLWNMVSRLHPMTGPDDPRTTRSTPAYSMSIWQDMDKYAEDSGVDYTVVGRDIYWFDTQLAWMELPLLEPEMIGQFPKVTEYGNDLRTRGVVTNGKGIAGTGYWGVDASYFDEYGGPVDDITILADRIEEADPTVEEVAEWSETAKRNVADRHPSPTAILIPANSTLLPGSSWSTDDLIPGGWFPVSVTSLCREVHAWMRLHEVVVTEGPPDGETIRFSAIPATEHRVDPV